MFLHYIWVVPIQAGVVLFFLYGAAGYAPYVGLFSVVILIFPLQGKFIAYIIVILLSLLISVSIPTIFRRARKGRERSQKVVTTRNKQIKDSVNVCTYREVEGLAMNRREWCRLRRQELASEIGRTEQREFSSCPHYVAI